jgi:hypothetical protein
VNDVDAERMAESHSLRIRQSKGKKQPNQDSARDRIRGSEPTDGRSVRLSQIAAASAAAAPAASFNYQDRRDPTISISDPALSSP